MATTELKTIVCIKQVPGDSAVEVDPVTGILRRDKIKGKLNPYDLFALEQAFLLRERFGGTITALSMGPRQAEESLRECLYMGADRACLICDRRLAGADVLATAWTLCQGIRRIASYDLILCGKQTTDGDTAQVGPEMAELLGIPHVTNVMRIEKINESSLTLVSALEERLYRLKLRLPCLAAVEKDINTPRLPSYRRKKETAGQPIEIWTLDDLPDREENHYGLSGSATRVERIFPPCRDGKRQMYDGSGAELADLLLELLLRKKMISR